MRILTLPNLLTVARLGLVPMIAYLLVAHNFKAAFVCFMLAGITDLADGILARRLDQKSPFGAWLDPAADKALIVIIFTLLTALGVVPHWLLIMVALRDILIVAGIADLYIAGKPPLIKPLLISKLNTLVQIIYLAMVLLNLAVEIDLAPLVEISGYLTAALTALSFLAYLRLWLGLRRGAVASGQGM